MTNGRHFFPTDVLIWFNPDDNTLAVHIFGLHRNEFDPMPADGPDNTFQKGNPDNRKQMWSREIKPPKGFTLTVYTDEPPTSHCDHAVDASVEGGAP